MIAVLATQVEQSALLEATWKLLAAGHDGSALESLVGCWREWPAPELGDLIDRFVERMTAKLPPVTGGVSSSNREAWLTTCAQHRTATLGRLFEALPQTSGAYAAERITALKAWPPTPALSTEIGRWLERCPFEGKNRARCVLPALEVLAAQRDVRIAPLLRRLSQQTHRGVAIRQLGLRAWKPLRALAEGSQRWALPRAASDAEREVLEKFRDRLAPAAAPEPSGVKLEDLFAAVYADPEDDTPRLMLADVLQERGDLRGEFIALQLARAATASRVSSREKELLATWGREWLGWLDPLLLRGGRVFSRGFLSECAYDGQQLAPGAADAPEWATVTHLDLTHAGQYASGAWGLMLSPRFKSLRHLSGVGDADLKAIADSRGPLPWESVRFSFFGITGTSWDLLVRSMPLPTLSCLGLRSVNRTPLTDLTVKGVAGLLDGRLGSSLQRLELGMRPETFGALIELAIRKRLTSIAVHPQSRELSLRYDVGPRAVVIHLDPVSEGNVARLALALKSLPGGTVDRALLVLPGRATVEGEEVLHGSRHASLGAVREALGVIALVLP